MQPAAMELLQRMQQALGSSTGLVLADTHSSDNLHNPVTKTKCSGLAANNRLSSQLVVPFEFKLHTTEAVAALRQLTETAGCVRRQQPVRRFICGVSITLETVEAFSRLPVLLWAPRIVQSHLQHRSAATRAAARLSRPVLASEHRDCPAASAGLCDCVSAMPSAGKEPL